jgi:hypothetical protein
MLWPKAPFKDDIKRPSVANPELRSYKKAGFPAVFLLLIPDRIKVLAHTHIQPSRHNRPAGHPGALR